MKINSPVIDKEHSFNQSESLYSRTTPKGVLLEVNDNFERLSGFKREELYGQAHNIVRHPDMPQAAFADLWKNLKEGRTWRGIIKNWSKDGGYYWVDANVSPVRDSNRNIIGFQSVRLKPSPEEVAEAEAAYKRINAGDTSLFIEHGRVVKKQPFKRFVLSNRVQWGTITLVALLPALSVLLDSPSKGLALFSAVITPVLIATLAVRRYNSIQCIIDWIGKILADGSLTTTKPKRLQTNYQLTTLGNRVLDFTCAIRATLKGVEDVSQRVAQAAQESQEVVNRVFDASKSQSAAASSSLSAIAEMSRSINQIFQQTELTKVAVESAGQEARGAHQESQHANAEIHALVDSIQTTATQIEVLGQRSEEIEDIVSLIESIADQTNLLALNAAIEAARAGEHGRGFAVVADEVRSLAERTSQATGEISTMIGNIRSQATQAVSAMGVSQVQANNSMIEMQRVADTLTRISGSMSNAVQMVNDISASTHHQNHVMDNLNHEVAVITEMAENNVGVAQNAKEVTEHLQGLSERLLESVRQYQV